MLMRPVRSIRQHRPARRNCRSCRASLFCRDILWKRLCARGFRYSQGPRPPKKGRGCAIARTSRTCPNLATSFDVLYVSLQGSFFICLTLEIVGAMAAWYLLKVLAQRQTWRDTILLLTFMMGSP